LSKFTEPHRNNHQPVWHEPVKRIVDKAAKVLKQERSGNREVVNERDLQRRLANGRAVGETTAW
jgi:hypothetical protein